MDSAFAWIGQIVEWVGQFFPRRKLLDTTEAAVKYVRGVPQYCGTGPHWYWPYTSTWIEFPTARQTDRLETQTMESTDGRAFIISGALTYAVSDIMKLVPTTYSPVTTIKEIAATAIHDVCCEMSWEQLQTMQQRGTLKTQLKNEARRLLKDYGVDVLDFRLHSLARCRVYRVSQATASEEN
jgi:hypothetical protein